MGPLSYMRSVVDRNIVMRRIPVFIYLFIYLYCLVYLTIVSIHTTLRWKVK